ncbi:hypothetical protein GCM10023235_27440 [Kitasatospora terrestris]|uniref:Uncharacterized protein n=1 Tax=Kitasatospora terrestris TaxID=258051 RepID=A0ABP9DNE4_9ACTN
MDATISTPIIFIGPCAPGEKKNAAEPPMPNSGSSDIIQSSPPARGSSGGGTNSTGWSGTGGGYARGGRLTVTTLMLALTHLDTYG